MIAHAVHCTALYTSAGVYVFLKLRGEHEQGLKSLNSLGFSSSSGTPISAT